MDGFLLLRDILNNISTIKKYSKEFIKHNFKKNVYDVFLAKNNVKSHEFKNYLFKRSYDSLFDL